MWMLWSTLAMAGGPDDAGVNLPRPEAVVVSAETRGTIDVRSPRRQVRRLRHQVYGGIAATFLGPFVFVGGVGLTVVGGLNQWSPLLQGAGVVIGLGGAVATIVGPGLLFSGAIGARKLALANGLTPQGLPVAVPLTIMMTGVALTYVGAQADEHPQILTTGVLTFVGGLVVGSVSASAEVHGLRKLALTPVVHVGPSGSAGIGVAGRW